MKAIILAAGFGIRMRPLSDRCPKPLLPVLGRPMIDYALRHLKTVGIRKMGINLCHFKDRMERYLGDGLAWGVDITLSREKEILGTGGGMGGMREFLSDEGPFLVYNGDNVSGINLKGVVDFHVKQKPMVTMVLCDFPRKNNVTLSPEGAVIDFSGKLNNYRPGKDQNLTFTGISMVDPGMLDLIPHGVPSHIIDIYRELIKSKPGSIAGYVVPATQWKEIGTPAAYLEAHKGLLLAGEGEWLSDDVPGRCVYTGSGSLIEPGAHLEGFVSLGKNCLVRKGAFLKNCVVWDNTVVESGTHLENGVIDGDWEYSVCG